MAVDSLVDSTALDSNLTAIANAIRTKGGTSASLAFPNGFISAIQAIPTGGGGASNIVQGTFTTGATRASTGTFTIPYTGSGYPVLLLVQIKGGAYNNGTGGDTAWYNATNRYDVGWVCLTKSQMTTSPTYATSGSQNYGTIAYIYKNSTSTGTTYTRSSSMTANSYTASSQNGATGANCIRWKGNGKTVGYYIGNQSSSAVGLHPSQEYEYIAIYSS